MEVFIMKAIWKRILAAFMLVAVLTVMTVPSLALAAGEEDTAVTAAAVVEASASSGKAMAAAIVVGLAAAAGAIAMGMAIAKSVDGISRQPEAEGTIRTTLMLGLVFVETAVIYALIVAILIIFVL